MRQFRANQVGNLRDFQKTFEYYQFLHYTLTLESSPCVRYSSTLLRAAPHQRKLPIPSKKETLGSEVEKWGAIHINTLTVFFHINGLKRVFFCNLFFSIYNTSWIFFQVSIFKSPSFFWCLGFISWDGHTVLTRVVHCS